MTCTVPSMAASASRSPLRLYAMSIKGEADVDEGPGMSSAGKLQRATVGGPSSSLSSYSCIGYRGSTRVDGGALIFLVFFGFMLDVLGCWP